MPWSIQLPYYIWSPLRPYSNACLTPRLLNSQIGNQLRVKYYTCIDLHTATDLLQGKTIILECLYILSESGLFTFCQMNWYNLLILIPFIIDLIVIIILILVSMSSALSLRDKYTQLRIKTNFSIYSPNAR